MDNNNKHNIMEHWKFSSPEELLWHVENAPSLLLDRQRSSITSNYDFTQTNSMQEAIELLKNGWPAGLEQVRARYGQMKEQFQQYLPAEGETKLRIFDTEGIYLNMDKAIAGEAECYSKEIKTKTLLKHGHYLQRLFISVDVCGNKTQDNIMNCAIAIIALIDAMEEHGINIEINIRVAGIAKYGTSFFAVDTMIKSFGESMDLDRLVFCLAHASFLRRLIFSVMETSKSHDFNKQFDVAGSKSRSMTFWKDLEEDTLTEQERPLILPCYEELLSGYQTPQQQLLTKIKDYYEKQ